MSHREFTQWLAFHTKSPIDDERCFDLGHALVRHTQIASNTPKDKSLPSIESLLPFSERPRDLNEFERGLLQWAESMGQRGR